MVNLSLADIYLWKKEVLLPKEENLINLNGSNQEIIDSIFFPRRIRKEQIEVTHNYPWNRQFMNEFLKSERKMIEEIKIWWTDFYDKEVGEELQEVLYYVLPASFNSETKASIAIQKGDVHIIQLSALKDCEEMSLLLILPQERKIPPEGSLIRIISPKKDYITDIKTGDIHYIISSEDYKIEDPSIVYLGIPYEKRRIHKFIIENLIKTGDLLARTFQSPISSSPYVKNLSGGITLSSYSPRSTFSEEFLKTLKMIHPPEFTNIGSEYPKSILLGKVEKGNLTGSFFNLKHLSPESKYHFSCFASPRYEFLINELKRKNDHNGEYSIACSLRSLSDSASERLTEILSKFVSSEISNMVDIDELKYEQDTDLFKVQKEIDEDLHIQIVNQRQIIPNIEKDFNELLHRKTLIKDWTGIMESLNVKKPDLNQVSIYASKSFNNLIKVAQSIARDNQTEVDSKAFKEAYDLFSQNAEMLIAKPEVQNSIKGIEEEGKNKKRDAIQSSLSIKFLTINELFEEIGFLFNNDLLELQTEIDKLETMGRIFEPIRGCYKWV